MRSPFLVAVRLWRSSFFSAFSGLVLAIVSGTCLCLNFTYGSNSYVEIRRHAGFGQIVVDRCIFSDKKKLCVVERMQSNML